MSRMPPISCFGSAPLMIFSWPAASISAIQLRRSLLGTISTPEKADVKIGRDAANHHEPHPEERRILAARLEGWPLARPCRLPSFETRARARSSESDSLI